MGKIAFVFAGQGAQTPGMGRSLYESNEAARRVMDEAEAVRPGTLSMCFEGGAAELNRTVNTQPCLYMMDYACAQALRAAGIQPDCVAGFSLGEVAAAAFAGMMTFEAGMRLVVRRAELMQACADQHPGGMAAIMRLSAEQVLEICSRFESAWPVNFNCPGQIVAACAEESMEQLMAQVKAAGGRAVRLKVSGAFHSPCMNEAAEGLSRYLAAHPLNRPEIPVYANRTARPYEGDLNGLMARQAASPVRWQQTVENLRADGVDTFVEVGPGSTLSGLIGKTDASLTTLNVCDAASLTKCLDILKGGAAC